MRHVVPLAPQRQSYGGQLSFRVLKGPPGW